jgi:hypothetical protein
MFFKNRVLENCYAIEKTYRLGQVFGGNLEASFSLN